MGLQNWAWWRWLMVAVIVGGLVGFVLTRLDADDPSIPSSSWQQMRFRLDRLTDTGESIVTRVRVGPVMLDHNGQKVQAVSYWERMRNKASGKWEPARQFRTVTPVPLSPASPRPDFGVMDYLALKKTEIPSLDYKFQWWWVPRNLWIMSLGGAVVVIGILWPLTLKGMVKLGLAEPPDEKAMDLSQVKSTAAAPTLATGPVVTADDRAKLDALNAELEANVGEMAVTGAATGGDKHASAPALPKTLVAETAAPTQAPGDPEKPKDYGGEFYPVARPVSKD